jgi:hypothetical protein
MSKKSRNKAHRKYGNHSSKASRQNHPNNIYRSHRTACVQLAEWIFAVSNAVVNIYTQTMEVLEKRGVYYLIGFLFGCGVLLMKGVTPKFNRILADENLIILVMTLVLGTLIDLGHKLIAVRQVSFKTVICTLTTTVVILIYGLLYSMY